MMISFTVKSPKYFQVLVIILCHNLHADVDVRWDLSTNARAGSRIIENPQKFVDFLNVVI